MEDIFKTYQNNPPHLFRPKGKYFITGATYLRKRHILSIESKQATTGYLFKSFLRFGWRIEDWVLLDNHYHVLAEAPDQAVTLSKAINHFHKFSALWIKRHLGTRNDGERIWYNYYDTCITYERSYFTRINYIWFNPVKHGYVLDPADYRFGSYYYRKQNGESLEENIVAYPWDKVEIKDDF
jgi:putative transposase